jgi:hypothetical protein
VEKTPAESSNCADLMARVGAFLFCWAGLEQQLTSSIGEARAALDRPPSPVKGRLCERLDLWLELASALPENEGRLAVAQAVRAQALKLRKVRNLIVHGLQAGVGAPKHGAAGIRCAAGGYGAPDEGSVFYSVDELKDFTKGIDACRRAFRNLAHFNYRIEDCSQIE